MKFSDLNPAQQGFIQKNIIRIFGKMPENLDDIGILDVYGYEAHYKDQVIRYEGSTERIARWTSERLR